MHSLRGHDGTRPPRFAPSPTRDDVCFHCWMPRDVHVPTLGRCPEDEGARSEGPPGAIGP